MTNSNLALCRYLALVFLLGFTVACAEPSSEAADGGNGV